jgi:glycosyltransferase involved in cell wall biosynthesis
MISVCVATYNGEKFIKEQIDSIINQLSNEDEIIISDDGSADKTLEILESYNDERIKIFHHKNDKSFRGKRLATFYYVTQNFENALMKASGDYIFLSDQDDIWKPNKVSEFKKLLEHHNVVMSSFEIINEKLEVTNKQFWTNVPYKKNVMYNIAKIPFIGCCMAFRKEFINKYLPFPKGLLLHDIWLGIMGVSSRSIAYINKPLISYRKHTNNVSATSGKSSNPIWLRVSYRLKMLCQYITFRK